MEILEKVKSFVMDNVVGVVITLVVGIVAGYFLHKPISKMFNKNRF